MKSKLPKLIAIDHDDYHAEFVGKTADGRQFFITDPFTAEGEFVALYLFDAKGQLIEALIDAFGPRKHMNVEARDAMRQKRLDDLGQVSHERIEIAPFSLERFGTTFGLIPNEPEDDDDTLSISLMPGDCMAFSEPWDSGDYDT